MTFNSELWRTEQLHSIRSKGILSDGGEVVIGNAGIAAKYNPIPSILDHLLSRPCSENMMLARFSLATHFEKQGLCASRDSIDVANDVLAWFLDPVCHACHGTGLKNKEQETCPVCGGTEKRPTCEPARKGVAEIESLFLWREIQLRKRMRGGDRNHMPAEYDGDATHRCNLGRVNGVTPRCPGADEQDSGDVWGAGNTY